MITIRLARADDANVLESLGRETFTETFGHLYPAKDLAAFLDSAHLAEEAKTLAQIHSLLAPGADLLLYGCDVAQGAQGSAFVTQLASIKDGAIRVLKWFESSIRNFLVCESGAFRYHSYK